MDVSHLCGSDFTLSNTGGLQTVEGTTEGQQRVLRRLMTTRGTYLWSLSYGAGLPTYLGQPTVTNVLQGVILQQMKLEKVVKQSPPPTVTVTIDDVNTVVANVRYIDADTNLTTLLVIPVE